MRKQPPLLLLRLLLSRVVYSGLTVSVLGVGAGVLERVWAGAASREGGGWSRVGAGAWVGGGRTGQAGERAWRAGSREAGSVASWFRDAELSSDGAAHLTRPPRPNRRIPPTSPSPTPPHTQAPAVARGAGAR